MEPAMTLIATNTQPVVPESFWFWSTLFVFAGFGFVIAASALYYASKSRTQPSILLRALGGGFLGSTSLASVSAAIGTRIEGLPFPMTWAQAGILTATGFLIGAAFTVLAGIVYVYCGIIQPVRRRFGRLQAAVGWVTLFAGFEPFGSWLQRTQRSLDMDEAWDEFTEAAIDFFRKLDTDGRSQRLSISGSDSSRPQPRSKLEFVIRALEVGSERPSARAQPQLDLRRAMNVVQPILAPLVETLTSRLRKNSLNFTVWRVHASELELEHLTSFPFERGEGAKEPLGPV